MIGMLGVIIGLMVTAAGVYYLTKEKNDKESVKIYSVISIAGLLVLIGSAARLILH